MALFSSLSERLNHIFSKLTKRGRLTELEIKTAMREVRVALLEADVNIFVAKKFIADVSAKAVGQEILQSLNPAQQVIKIVNEELIALMGSSNAKLEVADRPPTVILMCGLQGAGKTTLCGKLALLLKKQNKKPLLVAGDIYRPAAIHQLQVVGGKAGVEVFEKGTQSPVKTAKQAVEYARSMGYDTVIVDTAGRLHIDEALMQELENIQKEVQPSEILLTVDAMTGQDAVNVAETFNKRLSVTGVILTKLDGDTRGGACLSIKAVTGKPIKFIGVGEKLRALLSRPHGLPHFRDGGRAVPHRKGAGSGHRRAGEKDGKEAARGLLHAGGLPRAVRIAQKDGRARAGDEHGAGHGQAQDQGERLRRKAHRARQGDHPLHDEEGARAPRDHQFLPQKAHRGGQRHQRAGRQSAAQTV